MTKFEDGPAQGQTLMIRRAPVFLRLTFDGKKWDALDQLDDEPLQNETLHVYRITDMPGHIHLNTGRKPGGGFFPLANYRFYQPQPMDEQVRTFAAWKSWCESQPRTDVPP